MSRKLSMGGSLIALMAATSFFATSAAAQDAADDTAELEAVVVTGTSLRGVAPIGSAVTSIGQQEIARTGAINASQLVNTVPAITTSGSAPQGENAYSYYSPQIHSLAGSASNSTLVIMDGLRLVGGGTQYSQTDPNIIPTSALQRVEVLADGASSVYGSDAVAGVVNFITRDTFDGLQFNAKAGFADDYQNRDFNFIWGQTWDTGGFYIAGQYSKQDILRNADRPFLARGDYRDIGGTNTNTFTCSPATIRTPASGSNVYLSPSATTTVSNAAENAPCNTAIYDNALPEQWRANVMVKVVQDINEQLRFTGKMVYNRQATEENGTPGTLSNVNVYGPGSGRGGQINPFFMAPAGEPGATTETINWLDTATSRDDWGTVNSQSEFFYATAVLDYEINDSWSAKLSNAFGSSRSFLGNNDIWCGSCANLAVNGTTQTSGSTTASSVAGQNVVVLNLPLTTANALDVWSPGASRTQAGLVRSFYQNDSENTNYNQINQTKLEFQGGLFKLPAGEVRMAIGGEYMLSRLEQKIRASNNTGPSNTGSTQRNYKYKRNSYSAYVEVAVPLVSPDMEIPLVRKLDANISGRYDHFSDVGSTENPKFAVDWEVFEGFKLRGNFSTAFVAPPLAVIGDPSQGYLYASGSVGVQGSLFVPFANYPELRGVPGCETVTTTTCNIGLGTNQGLRRQLGGGFLDIKPQTGDAWSVGADFTPTFLPGFFANITLWNNTFEGGANSPNPNSIVNSAGLNDRLTICPTGCTTAQINEFANLAGGASISGAVPQTVYFLLDQSSGNVLNLKVQGIDGQIAYRIPTDSFGTFRLGDSFTYFTKFDQNFGGGTSFSVLNTSGYNTTFPSIRFKNRASLGWDNGPVSIDLFANYTGGYRNWSNTSVTPISVDAVGNPTGGGDKVKSQTIFDLHASYSFDEGVGPLSGAQVYVDVQNLFDKDPPFYNGNTSGILGGAWGFNGFTSNPIGRLVSFGIRADF